VPELIDCSRKTDKHPDVDFQVMDVVEDPVPESDVVFVCLVFQHLSNAPISAVIARM